MKSLREFFCCSAYFVLRRNVCSAIVWLCGVADILSAIPLPFLGVSSLNLAAPSGAAFFLWSVGGLFRGVGLGLGAAELVEVDRHQREQRFVQPGLDDLEARPGLDALLVQVQRTVHLDL